MLKANGPAANAQISLGLLFAHPMKSPSAGMLQPFHLLAEWMRFRAGKVQEVKPAGTYPCFSLF
jgi:hypothetical protein